MKVLTGEIPKLNSLFGSRNAQCLEGEQQKHEMVIKQALLAPIWTRIGVPCIVFREESDGDTPGAQFWAKTTKNEQTHF